VSPADGEARCGSCAWAHARGPGRPVLRCLRHPARAGARTRMRVTPDQPACAAHTRAEALDCQACGACCREAYHRVEVSPRDPFARSHATLLEVLVEEGSRLLVLPRPGGDCRCLAREGDRFACTAYAARPRTCRDFPTGAESCLEARRRVGLTP